MDVLNSNFGLNNSLIQKDGSSNLKNTFQQDVFAGIFEARLQEALELPEHIKQVIDKIKNHQPLTHTEIGQVTIEMTEIGIQHAQYVNNGGGFSAEFVGISISMVSLVKDYSSPQALDGLAQFWADLDEETQEFMELEERLVDLYEEDTYEFKGVPQLKDTLEGLRKSTRELQKNLKILIEKLSTPQKGLDLVSRLDAIDEERKDEDVAAVEAVDTTVADEDTSSSEQIAA